MATTFTLKRKLFGAVPTKVFQSVANATKQGFSKAGTGLFGNFKNAFSGQMGVVNAKKGTEAVAKLTTGQRAKEAGIGLLKVGGATAGVGLLGAGVAAKKVDDAANGLLSGS